MQEVRTTPLTRDEMEGLIARYSAQANEGHREGQAIRQRIVKGQQVLALPDLTMDEKVKAEQRMNALREALRGHEWSELLGVSLAVAHGTATVINDAMKDHELPVPPGAIVRVYVPGVADVTVKMDGYGGGD